ncbi:uncharacterized protein LOC124305795 [Neodiprion virginianus]|uniref:uncharacterized protein LOC124305795 n=1 Tax=Neodiprion virginianus TaxID=2961670 RepID=UPI001EE6A249|nr:uncharacterized protein LOC124305795 [Neodiprion virginianus]
MKRVAGRNLKFIVITCYCLCITITNCDDNLIITKRNLLKSIPESRAGNPSKHVPVQSFKSTDDSKLSDSSSSKLTNSSQEKNSPIQNVEDSDNGIKSKDNRTVTLLTDQVKKEANLDLNVTAPQTTIQPQILGPNLSVNTGALWRGISVFMGLTVLVIAYIILRCVRLSKNRTQMVRKYGVLAHRQDVEMRPLPLDDEDEDDTTVFDASEIGIHDKHRQTA